MPTYLHICENLECNNEWEDYYSNKDLPPTHCPTCNQETAKRVICGINRGVVELYGDDLKNKVVADAKQLKKDASQNANVYANLLGESRYHELQTKLDRRGK